MKKIIFSTYDDIKNPYFGGGGASAIHQVATRLSKKFEIVVYTGKYPKSINEKIDGVNYRRIGIDVAFSPQLSQIIYSMFLPFYVLTAKYDMWIESFTPPFSTGFLQLFTKKPVIGLVHMLSGEDMKRKYKLPFDLVENVGLKTYQHFIVNSEFIKRKIQKVNEKANVEIIGNGIEKISKNSGKAKYALFIGRIEINQKGLDLLLESWGKVKGKLKIAGNGIEFLGLKKLILKRELHNKIELLGKVLGDEKDRLFRDAAFVVVPSRFETFSISTLEAFSYGLPVVSFDIEGLKWTPKNAIVKIEPFKIDIFSKKCRDLFANEEKRNSLGKVGINFAKKYTWNEIGNRYYKYINNI